MTSIILADCSASMSEMSGDQRRIAALQQALAEVRRDLPEAEVWCFNSVCFRSPDGHLPEPTGGTEVALAIRTISLRMPKKLVVISDGLPISTRSMDAAGDALLAARNLACEISTIFVGDEEDYAAIAFMRQLAWCSSDGIGSARVLTLAQPKRLAHEVVLLLSAP